MLPTWLLRKTNAESGSLLHPTKSAATAPRAPMPVSLTAAALRDDVAALAATLGPDPSLRCDLVSTGSTYTRLWTEEDWRQHASICRYSRHLRFWHNSTIARAIAPLVTATRMGGGRRSVRSCARPYRLSLPFQRVLFGQAAALLLTMRTNASLARLAEARALAGRVGTTPRDRGTARRVVDGDSPRPLVQLAARRAPCPGASAGRSRRRRCGPLRGLRGLLPARPGGRAGGALPPLASVGRLRAIVQHAAPAAWTAPRTGRSRAASVLSTSSARANDESPVPPAYTRHTSRILLIFLVLVPVGRPGLRLRVHRGLVDVFITYPRGSMRRWRRAGVVRLWSRDAAAGPRRIGAAGATRAPPVSSFHRGTSIGRGALPWSVGCGRPRDGRPAPRVFARPPRAALSLHRGRRARRVPRDRVYVAWSNLSTAPTKRVHLLHDEPPRVERRVAYSSNPQRRASGVTLELSARTLRRTGTGLPPATRRTFT